MYFLLMIGGILVALDEMYHDFIEKFNNYCTSSQVGEKLYNRIGWFCTSVSIWLDYNSLHRRELPALKRGNIVLVEIGENFGMEFSGRHHCIVLRNSPLEQDQVLVLPITSKKPKNYQPNNNGIYLEFPRINGFNGFSDPDDPNHPDTGKHWANILNIRNISKSRIHYPTRIINVDNQQLNKISNSIIANIALRRNLLQ